ncbi:MAG: 50S ribosome-binding GTPase, partial [Anaerolineales bacterium]|nr:50S ribosome-binding GTPase [Anaerolineales bacterium]
IACLEEMLSIIPKHKGTDHIRADYRRRLSKLKEEAQERKSGGRRASSFRIEREGAGQVVVIGPSNTGKSSLLRVLTNAEPEVSEVPFTTWQPVPGMLVFEKVPIQLVDTPALDRDFVEPGLMDLIRRADLVLLMLDIQASPDEQYQNALALLEEHRILPEHRKAQVESTEQRITFVPMLVMVNKCDHAGWDEDFAILRDLLPDSPPMLAASVLRGRGLKQLQRLLLERMDVIRVYSKEPGKEPDLNVPFIIRRGATVEELAGRIHKDFLHNLKSARIWGSGAFDGQMVTREHVLQDGDVVELKI